MDKAIQEYFEALKNKYETDVILTKPESNTKKLDRIPTALQPLYKFTSRVKLPFGEIFDIEEALEQSERSPFKPDWFAFGRDKYFSFWLCSFIADEEGLSFTYWDHEAGNEIDGAVWEDIVSFLNEMEKEHNS